MAFVRHSRYSRRRRRLGKKKYRRTYNVSRGGIRL